MTKKIIKPDPGAEKTTPDKKTPTPEKKKTAPVDSYLANCRDALIKTKEKFDAIREARSK